MPQPQLLHRVGGCPDSERDFRGPEILRPYCGHIHHSRESCDTEFRYRYRTGPLADEPPQRTAPWIRILDRSRRFACRTKSHSTNGDRINEDFFSQQRTEFQLGDDLVDLHQVGHGRIGIRDLQATQHHRPVG